MVAARKRRFSGTQELKAPLRVRGCDGRGASRILAFRPARGAGVPFQTRPAGQSPRSVHFITGLSRNTRPCSTVICKGVIPIATGNIRLSLSAQVVRGVVLHTVVSEMGS